MKRILTAVVLIPLVLMLVLFGPHWLMSLATAIVSALAAWEFLTLADASGARPPRIAVLVAIVALFAGSYEWPDMLASILGLLAMGLLVYCVFTSPVERVMRDVSSSVFCLLYTGFTLICIPALREQSNGPSLIVFLMLVVWAGDIAALYTGRKLGRHKLAPSLSPNKSWEGTIGSIIGSLLAAIALLELSGYLSYRLQSAHLFYPGKYGYWLLIAVLLNIAAQVGDLAESALKRSVGVKDSGTIVPGHGGILDRIDALLLAAPVLWYAQLAHQGF